MKAKLLKVLNIRRSLVQYVGQRKDLKFHFESGELIGYYGAFLGLLLVHAFWCMATGIILGVLIGAAWELYSLITKKGVADWLDLEMTIRGAIVGSIRAGLPLCIVKSLLV